MLRQHAADLRSGTLALDEYVEATLGRVERDNAALLAVLPETDRRARLRHDAQALAARWPDPGHRPQLYGVLVGIKDVLRVDGVPTRAGSALPPEVLGGGEAQIVARLRDQGALVFGKLATAEFAYADPPATRNPHNTAHTPGGSSSGSAAAVGAGWLGLTIGTQTIGSVIRPAAFCGIVGFKPTYGRLPVGGLLHFSRSIDTLGMFTRDVADMAYVARALFDDWQEVATTSTMLPTAANDSTGLRLIVPDGAFLAQVDPPALERFEATLRVLAAGGVDVVRVAAFADLADLTRRHANLVLREFAEMHDNWFREWGALYRPGAASGCRAGAAVTADAYAESLASSRQLRTWLDTTLAERGAAAWACPAAVGTAPLGFGSTGNPALSMPFSHAGVPAITVPCDWVDTSGGALPLGLQLASAFGADERLLRIAGEVEDLLRPIQAARGTRAA